MYGSLHVAETDRITKALETAVAAMADHEGLEVLMNGSLTDPEPLYDIYGVK